VVSDAHEGLKNAIAAVLDGASWQRCRTHFMRNLLSRVPRSAQAVVATLVRSTFAQPDAQSTWAQHGRIVEQLRERFPRAADLLEEATPDLLALHDAGSRPAPRSHPDARRPSLIPPSHGRASTPNERSRLGDRK
jgi:transposase-like protein